MHPILNTFQLVKNNEVVSPILTTTREYGNWFEKVFDTSICNLELYMKSIKRSGESVLEKHPGTKIGSFFDKTEVNSEMLKSWFIMQDSQTMKRLVRLKLAEMKDAIPISVNDEHGRRMIRVYTVPQIEMYIKMRIDRDFVINGYIEEPKQVKISDIDMKNLIKPEVNKKQKRLF